MPDFARMNVRLRKLITYTLKRPVILQDEYATWLMFANAGMTDPGTLHCIDYATSHLPTDDPMLEIGSFCGLSTNLISYFARKHGRTNDLFTSDKWEFEGAEGNSALGGHTQLTHEDYRRFVKESFMRNVKTFSATNLPRAIEEFSDRFFELWREEATVKDIFGRACQLGGALSFAFIDGNHTYDYAKRDFMNTDEFLRPGGFIYFDDSADFSTFGVREVIKEVKRMPRYEEVMRNPHYLFRKVD